MALHIKCVISTRIHNLYQFLGNGAVDNNPNPQIDRAFSKKIPRVGSAPSVKKMNGTAIPS